MSNLHLTSETDWFYQKDYIRACERWGVKPYFVRSKLEQEALDQIRDYICPQKKEETMAEMKKYYTHSGSGGRYETQDAATTAAKKYMESMSKAYNQAHDIYVLEAIACVTFPVPAYEVVSLDAKATT